MWRLSNIAFFFLLVAIGSYTLFETRTYWSGPTFAFTMPVVTEATTSVFTVRALGTNISAASINGAPVPVTVSGTFEDTLLLAPGPNDIEVEARDRFGNSTAQKLQVIYVPPLQNAPEASATSTATTTIDITSKK
jgi:Glucodextranase, domain B